MLRATLQTVWPILLLLAGLDVVACIKPTESSALALHANSGDASHAKAAGVKSVSMSSGGAMQGLQSREAPPHAAHAMRREPLGANGAFAGGRLASDMVDLLANTDGSAPTNDEVVEACKEARAVLAARRASENSTIDMAVLLATANISAETLAAEADPCKALNDRLATAMAGHVIVAGRDEVPISTTTSPLTKEQEDIEKLVRFFVGTCCVVAFMMFGVFVVSIIIVKRKKKKKELPGQAPTGADNTAADAAGSRAESLAGSDPADF